MTVYNDYIYYKIKDETILRALQFSLFSFLSIVP